MPVSLVTCNDIAAYFFGCMFGRTPLIKVSPRKTWEGFVGGFITTVIFGFFVRSYDGTILANMHCSFLDI